MGAKLLRVGLTIVVLAAMLHSFRILRQEYSRSYAWSFVITDSDGKSIPFGNVGWFGVIGVTMFQGPGKDPYDIQSGTPTHWKDADYGWPCKWLQVRTFGTYEGGLPGPFHLIVMNPAIPFLYFLLMGYTIGWAASGRVNFSICGFHHSRSIAVGAVAGMTVCVWGEYLDVSGMVFSHDGPRWLERRYADTAVTALVLLGVTAANGWYHSGPSRTASAPG